MCTIVLKEAIDYYTSNSSSVFCTLLDATKPFDRVDYCKLFRSLTEKDLPPTVLRLLLNTSLYPSAPGNPSLLKLNISPPFTASNGVKQDVVLSPILLCVYIDSLLHSLAESSVGCFIGRVFVGALVYAVDIVLLSPTTSGMWTLLHVCDFSVIFNAAKSKCLWFKARHISASYYKNTPSFLIDGSAIKFVSSWPHLKKSYIDYKHEWQNTYWTKESPTLWSN